MRKNGKWLIKGTRKIFENDFLVFSLDEVINPQGQDAEYAIIQYPNSVAVIALDENDNFLLTEQFRYALKKESIEAVGGAIENETPREAARRELKEELGIIAEDWIKFGAITSNTSMTRDSKELFLARILTFTEPEREATEQIKLFKISLTEALGKVRNGEISHDITCLLILKTAEIIRNEEKKNR